MAGCARLWPARNTMENLHSSTAKMGSGPTLHADCHPFGRNWKVIALGGQGFALWLRVGTTKSEVLAEGIPSKLEGCCLATTNCLLRWSSGLFAENSSSYSFLISI